MRQWSIHDYKRTLIQKHPTHSVPKGIANAVVPTTAVWFHKRSIQFNTEKFVSGYHGLGLKIDELCNIEQERLAQAIVLFTVEERIDL